MRKTWQGNIYTNERTNEIKQQISIRRGYWICCLIGCFRLRSRWRENCFRLIRPEFVHLNCTKMKIFFKEIHIYHFNNMSFRIIVTFGWIFRSRSITWLRWRINRDILGTIWFANTNCIIDENIIIWPTNDLIHTESRTMRTRLNGMQKLTYVFLISRKSAWPIRDAFTLTNDASFFFSFSFSAWRFFS